MQTIADAAQRLGDELCARTGLREKIRRHPLMSIGVSTGLGAVLGSTAGPPALRALARVLASQSSFRRGLSARPRFLSDLVLRSLGLSPRS